MSLYTKINIITLYTIINILTINILTLYTKINIMTVYAKIDILTVYAKINIMTDVDFNTLSAVSWFIKISRSLISFCLIDREHFSVLIFFQLIEHVQNKKLKVVVANIKPTTTTRNISNFQTKHDKYNQWESHGTCYLKHMTPYSISRHTFIGQKYILTEIFHFPVNFR